MPVDSFTKVDLETAKRYHAALKKQYANDKEIMRWLTTPGGNDHGEWQDWGEYIKKYSGTGCLYFVGDDSDISPYSALPDVDYTKQHCSIPEDRFVQAWDLYQTHCKDVA